MTTLHRRAIALLPCTCLALVACGRGQRGHGWDWERMRQQPRYDIYEKSDVFANGRVMQHPPVGTVAREQAVGDAPLVTGKDDRGYITAIPVRVTPDLLAAGRTRYDIFCAVCHGAGGYGGSIIAMNMQPPRPPSLRSSAMRALPTGMVYQAIANGFGRMPSYAEELTVRERWAVVAYLRQLQSTPGAGTDAARADSIRAAELATWPTDTTRPLGGDSTGARSSSTVGAPR